jgi:hypothetical protein
MVDPAPDGLGGHDDLALREQILNVAQAKGEPEVQPYRLTNDFGWEPVAGIADFRHALGYSRAEKATGPGVTVPFRKRRTRGSLRRRLALRRPAQKSTRTPIVGAKLTR